MREDDIRRAIKNLPGDRFERFARELLRRALYPGLNPTSNSHDLGEDARTELSTIFLHDERWVSLIASKTCSWSKIAKDCQRCKETGREIEILVFATAGHPRTDIQEEWRAKVKDRFGWTLECRTLSWLAPVASHWEHEDLVDDYLQIPPPGGDYVRTIDREFANHTDQAVARVRLVIPGIAESLPRREISWIEDQLHQGNAVLLTGDAGTGKSAIGAELVKSAAAEGKAVLYLDARSIAYVQSEPQLRKHLGLAGPVRDAVWRIGQFKRCRVIIDQLDSIAGEVAADVLAQLVVDCSGLAQVEVVALSRKAADYEKQLVEQLVNAGLVELTSHPLSEDVVVGVLQRLGIPDSFNEVIALGRNLLNLELIGAIKHAQPDSDFSVLLEEVDLWERYLKALIQGERVGSSQCRAEQIIARAVELARTALTTPNGAFPVAYPPDRACARLTSAGIIVPDRGRSCRFRHEKLQDFVYARDAAQRAAMPAEVLCDIGRHRARSVLLWMDKIYSRQSDEIHVQFLRATFNVGE